MALRRTYQGYGSAKPTMPNGSNHMPLPPPPDGQPPVRLPIGMGPEQEGQPPMENGMPVQGEDPLVALKRRLGQM